MVYKKDNSIETQISCLNSNDNKDEETTVFFEKVGSTINGHEIVMLKNGTEEVNKKIVNRLSSLGNNNIEIKPSMQGTEKKLISSEDGCLFLRLNDSEYIPIIEVEFSSKKFLICCDDPFYQDSKMHSNSFKKSYRKHFSKNYNYIRALLIAHKKVLVQYMLMI